MNKDRIIQSAQLFLSDKRNQRRLLKVFIAVFITSSIISFLGYFTVIRVSFTQGDAPFAMQPETYLYQASPENKTKLFGISNTFIVPRTADALFFKHGNNEAFATPSDGSFGFGFESIDVSLGTIGTAEKISSGGTRCPITAGNGIYSYECANPSSFKKYEGTENGLPTHVSSGVGFSTNYPPAYYKDGILIQHGAGDVVAYVVPGAKEVQTIPLPVGFLNTKNYILIFTDSTDPRNTGFVVYDYNTGVGHYYSDFKPSVTPKRINRQYSLDVNKDVSSCVLVGTSFTCYHGSPGEESHSHDDEPSSGEEEHTEPYGGTIEVIDVSIDTPKAKAYQGPDDGGINHILATASGVLFGRNDTLLERIELKDKAFVTEAVNYHVEIASASTFLYYVHNNKTYRYDENTRSSSLYYKNDQETITKIVANGEELLAMSYSHKDPLQLLNVFDIKADN